ETTDKGCITNAPVGKCFRTRGEHDLHDHPDSDDDKGNDCENFHQRKEKFGFAKAFYCQGINPENNGKEDGAPVHARNIWKPEFHNELNGNQLKSHGNGPVVPVVPTQSETKTTFDIFGAVSEKCT